MQIIRETAGLRAAVAAFRADGHRIALVPTMGALHAGHLALVEAARRPGTRVVASIFVNPRQFGAGEDLSRYPRREAADARLLTEAGCDLLWAPDAATMYPAGFATLVSVTGISEPLEGLARAGHFDGVATVVAKLFNQVARPTAPISAKRTISSSRWCGEWSPTWISPPRSSACRPSVTTTAWPCRRATSTCCPTSATRRWRCPARWGLAARAISRGDDPARAVGDARASLEAAGFAVDYVALVDAETLDEPAAADRPRRLLAAARLGTTRLIDNVPVE